jgi:hypothetical protein
MEMMISYINRVLGHVINTRKLTVAPPDDYVAGVVKRLRTTFGPHRNVFTVLEVEELTGKLGHLALTAPWLKYLMTHVYASLAHTLNMNHWALVRSSSSFREGLKRIKQASKDELGQREKSYFQAENARKIHHSKRIYPFNKTLRKELKLINQPPNRACIPSYSIQRLQSPGNGRLLYRTKSLVVFRVARERPPQDPQVYQKQHVRTTDRYQCP